MRRIVALLMLIAAVAGGVFTNQARGQSVSSAAAKTSAASAAPVKVSLPMKDGSVRFAVIGDTGTGTEQQQQLAADRNSR